MMMIAAAATTSTTADGEVLRQTYTHTISNEHNINKISKKSKFKAQQVCSAGAITASAQTDRQTNRQRM